jgi:hypothetical protein
MGTASTPAALTAKGMLPKVTEEVIITLLNANAKNLFISILLP